MDAQERQDKRAVLTRKNVYGLIVLNAVLLMLLGLITFAEPATAQERSRGSYTFTAGGANGANGSVVYIIDATNQELVAITYDQNEQQLQGIGFRNLARDAADRARSSTGDQ